MFGEGRPYVSALIVPDLVALAAQCRDKAQEDADDGSEAAITATSPQVKSFLDEVISAINSRLDRWEQIKEYRLLDQPLIEANGELTSSLMDTRRQATSSLLYRSPACSLPSIDSMGSSQLT